MNAESNLGGMRVASGKAVREAPEATHMASCSSQAILDERRAHLEKGDQWLWVPIPWDRLEPWQEVKCLEQTCREQRLEYP